MIVVKCPDNYTPGVHPVIFMAGGISGCHGWQTTMTEMLDRMKVLKQFVLVNPRRSNFDIHNPSLAEEQIDWEHLYLNMADEVSFWFPKETLCPITLYELGVWAAKGKKIHVGCEPGYKREIDVRKQLSLLRPEVRVVDSLEKLVIQVAFSIEHFGKRVAS